MPAQSTPTIPLIFDSDARDYEQRYLEIERLEDYVIVRWPLIGAQLVAAKNEYYYDVDKSEALNAGTFHNWDYCGFSVGDYHEFFCYPLEYLVTFFVSGAEVSFGRATPLVATLYDGYHDNDYFDEWDTLTTVRILGAKREDVEAIFINASLAYNQKIGILPRVMSLNIPDEWLVEPATHVAEGSVAPVFRLPPAVGDITALRFYYNGLVQVDSTAACLYFYRVLEYFAFLAYHKEIGVLRHDASLSDIDFTKRVIEIAYRDEKGPILRLVNQVADETALANVVAAGILKSKDASALGAELYNFRNAIVHGKHAGGYVPETSSVISGASAADRWRPILRMLAKKVLHDLGRKIV